MRTKNRKRIGPVPIALVAVLALAALLSAGLLLVPSGSDVTHAQGLSDGGIPKKPVTGDTGVGGSGCGITLDADTEATTTGVQLGDQDVYVAGGKCNLSDDTVDVVFENRDEDNKLPLVVYATGGDDFPSVQALVADGEEDDDMIPDAVGERGVDEYLLNIPEQTNSFGTTSRGVSTVTVTRSMAGDDGQVYLFGYFNDDDAGETAQEFLINGMFDANRDGVIDADDARDGTPSATLSTTQIIDGKFNIDPASGGANEAIDDADDATSVADANAGHVVINGVLYPVSDAVDGAPPVSLGTETDGADPGQIMLIDGRADVDGDDAPGADQDDNRDSTLTGTFNSDDDLATVAIVDGAFDVDGDTNINDEDTYDGTRYVIRVGRVYTIMPNSGRSPVDLGNSPDGTPGNSADSGEDNPDRFARDSVYHVPFAANTENFFPRVFTNAAGDPMGIGVDADIVVLVRFQNPPAEKASDGTTLSKVEQASVNSGGKANVMVRINDANNVGLNGFATLMIDADAGSDVLFTDSNLKAHRIEIDDGMGSTEIKGLPKTGAVRVKVTATFGDFEISGYVTRLGRSTMLDVKTYSCVTKVGNLPAFEDSEKCRMEAGTKAADLTESMNFAPGEKFLIVGTLNDAAGNTIDKTLSADQLTPSGTTQAIESIVNVRLSEKADATNTLPAFPAVSAANSNARLYATVDDATNNARLGDYEIEVSGGGQKQTVMITVSGMAENFALEGPSHISLGGSAKFTVSAIDMAGNLPAGDTCITVLLRAKDSDPADVSVKKESAAPCEDESKLKIDGTITFTVFAPVEAVGGARGRIAVLHNNTEVASHSVTFGEPSMPPGMPMNVMAEATSHDMIAVSWESPADDGGSDITGYVLQSKTGTMDFMTIAASSAEVWWNTLDCPMMNAEIPDDATPAPPMDDTDMTSPYCAMYPGLSAEARIVVDKVFDDEYGTISGTSHSDMGLMAETTYYYRVSAINSVDQGEYSDGMAMATTMVTVVDAPPLGPASGLTATANADGSVMLTWTTGTSATHHFVAGTDGAFDATGIKVWKFSSAMGTHTVSADLLTSGTVYDFYVISGQFEEQADGSWPGKWAAEGWSNAATATAN